MDLATFQTLLSPRGQAALAAATALAPTEATLLTHLTTLPRHYPPALAAAALDQVLLRRRAAASGKFDPVAAEAMYFTRDGLEQATGMAIASYRAQRYRHHGRVADLGCGLGGDALALARQHPVLAVDRDYVRLAMARANAVANGVGTRVVPVLADLTLLPPPRADALFCDPARRMANGQRIFTVRDYQPPLDLVMDWRKTVSALGIKVAPGIAYADLPPASEAEVEFISERGTLKEAVLWFGPLRTATRRATVLPAGATLTASEPPVRVAIEPPGLVLYDPDPAIVRAHLVEDLAVHLGAAKIDEDIAYLTGSVLVPTPFARAFRIVATLPFSLKRLRAQLRDLDAGIVTVKKRGSPLDVTALASQLRGHGARPLTVILTHLRGRPAALIGEPVRNAAVDRSDPSAYNPTREGC